MTKYVTVGYYLQSVSLLVEANSEEEAKAIAYDKMRYGGEGVEGEGDWDDEMEVWEA
jgi:hypothetical protein